MAHGMACLHEMDALHYAAKDDVALVVVENGATALRVVALLCRDEELRGVSVRLVHKLLLGLRTHRRRACHRQRTWPGESQVEVLVLEGLVAVDALAAGAIAVHDVATLCEEALPHLKVAPVTRAATP